MEFRIVEEKDHQLVIDHLRKTFFIDEPLNKAVELCPNGEGHETLEHHCCDTMRDGYSILALEDGEVLGVVLNGVLKQNDTMKAIAKLNTMNDEKFTKIFSLLYSITEDLDLFNKHQVDSIFECRIVSVDPKARGKGLAGELMRRTIQIAKDSGFEIMKGDATGVYSQKICEKYGMEPILELLYKDYLDSQTGLPVFDIEEPHKSLKIMILRL